MKLKFILLLSTLLLSQSIFAVAPETCPAANLLASTVFDFSKTNWQNYYFTVKAESRDYDNSGVEWELISDDVIATSTDEAIQYSNTAVKHLQFVNGPVFRESGYTTTGHRWALYDCNYRDSAGIRFYAVYDDDN